MKLDGTVHSTTTDLHQSLCLVGFCTDADIPCHPCTEIEGWKQDSHGSQVCLPCKAAPESLQPSLHSGRLLSLQRFSVG